MYTLKIQRDVNDMYHEVTCSRQVELASQEVVNVRRVKRVLRDANVILKAVTKSQVQFVQDGSLTSEESSQWMKAIKDRDNTAKHRAQDKLEEMGALDQVAGPPSKAVVKTQLKRSKRTLRATSQRRLLT